MRIVYCRFALELEFCENQVQVLTIENPDIYAEAITSLWNQDQGEEGVFIVSDGEKTRKWDKEICLIVNPLLVDYNDRKLISKLYQELNSLAISDMIEETTLMNAAIVSYLDELMQKEPYMLSSKLELSVQGLLKLYDVKFSCLESSMLERLMNYMKIYHQVCRNSCFILIGVKEFLTDTQIDELYKFTFGEKIYTWILEGHYFPKREYEHNVIIDKDLCIIEA